MGKKVIATIAQKMQKGSGEKPLEPYVDEQGNVHYVTRCPRKGGCGYYDEDKTTDKNGITTQKFIYYRADGKTIDHDVVFYQKAGEEQRSFVAATFYDYDRKGNVQKKAVCSDLTSYEYWAKRRDNIPPSAWEKVTSEKPKTNTNTTTYQTLKPKPKTNSSSKPLHINAQYRRGNGGNDGF